jgi:hypothetical protein
MRDKGHETLIVAKDKDVTLALLHRFDLPYTSVGKYSKSNAAKMIDMQRITYRIYRLAKNFSPDILTGFGGINAAHASLLLRKPCISFSDSDSANLTHSLLIPFVSAICTPSCFSKDLGRKQIRFNGYKELAYLHPKYFKPDPSVLDEIGIADGDKFVVVRFVAWEASHDIGQHGFDLETKRKLVNELEKHARVLITSESPLPEEFESYRITVAPERLHDLLYYATLYVGEGATMASECAVLGTPAIYVNTLSAGTLQEQKQKYGLICCFHDMNNTQERVIEKAIELISKENLKEEWATKRQRMLADKIDVTQFMVDFIENYP